MSNYRVVETSHVPIKMWTQGVPVEEQVIQKLKNVANLPFVAGPVAIMPDVHDGKGAVIGSVVATQGAIIPAAVGVDIGCGMMYQRTKLRAERLPDNLGKLRSELERFIPVGRTDNGGENDRGSWSSTGIPQRIQDRFANELYSEYLELVKEHPRASHRRVPNMLGTLGSGNHFVEVVVDEEGFVGIMLHSGSRGPGASIGNYFIQLARKDMERYFINLPDKDLAYLVEGTENFHAYRRALAWAQKYARINREIMMESALIALDRAVGFEPISMMLDETVVNCHHNYVNEERHFGKKVLVTRKGAVRAKLGDLGIIPGSMGAKSFIVRGKGNHESLHSCSHGAGRAMSRTKARNLITEAEHAAATAGVECIKTGDNSEGSILEESPAAYKDIDAVMAAQSDLVEIVHTLKQIVCVKG